MKAFLNHTLLILFLTASLLMGGFIVGPFSVRIYVSVFMLFYLFLSAYRFRFNKEIILYGIYILFYWIALIINGEINEVNFIKYFFGRFFICFIAVYVIQSLVKDKNTLHKVIIFFIGLGLLNGIVSLMQFTGNAQAMLLPMILNPTEIYQERLEFYGRFESGLGIGVVGLFGSIVKNGYLAALFAALSLYVYQYVKNNWHKSFFFFISIFLLYVVFLTQQRLVLIATTGFYLFFFYKNKRIFYTMLIMAIPAFILVLASDLQMNPESLGRIASLEDNTRVKLFSLGIQFVRDNFFFGGQNAFSRLLDANGIRVSSAHNFFLNAIINSGFFGAVFVIILYFKMLGKSIKLMLKKLSHNKSSMFIAGSLSIYLLNSLTHNTSLVSGDEIIWILYIMLLKSETFEKQKNETSM